MLNYLFYVQKLKIKFKKSQKITALCKIQIMYLEGKLGKL